MYINSSTFASHRQKPALVLLGNALVLRNIRISLFTCIWNNSGFILVRLLQVSILSLMFLANSQYHAVAKAAISTFIVDSNKIL